MKKQIAIATALFLLVLMALPAYAQTQTIKVKVPFSFNLGDKNYPSGEYAFSTVKDNIIQLEKDGRYRVALFLTDRVSGQNNAAQVRFHCYDNQYFLSQIWIPGVDSGFAPHRSRGEGEVSTRIPGRYVALVGTSPQQ